ncbi:hypothetical protein, partial [Kiloniella spongiae]|uniref:hypothetical protein n=1 Tax=Kiloniella spongiae TaxID=1489064 RepID=UPI00194E978B
FPNWRHGCQKLSLASTTHQRSNKKAAEFYSQRLFGFLLAGFEFTLYLLSIIFNNYLFSFCY